MVAWPSPDELKRVLDVSGDDWDVTLERVLDSAIARVKAEVGAWDEAVDVPDDNLAQAALRMAELMALRPESAVGTERDPTYQRLIYGRRRQFGVSS